MMRRRLLILIHHAVSIRVLPCWSFSVPLQDRRVALRNLQYRCFIPTVSIIAASETFFPASSQCSSFLLFETTAYGRQEYTNSITASRDTNLSPAEAYDVIRQKIPTNKNDQNARALDLGAGAGLSTAILCNEKGYLVTDAVDWSRTAWDDSVTRQPNTIQFYEMDDSSFFEYALSQQLAPPRPMPKYDVIVYNFACNFDKAVYAATTFLNCDNSDSVLLAPVNDRRDYWYKQTYVLLDCQGNIVWKSDPEVGAWSVQFQPDVTAPSCVGIWCGGFNGYQSKKSGKLH